MEKYKKFNLNHYFLVEITEDGFQHLKDTVGEDYILHCILNKKEEIEGITYYKLQAHNIIDLFGNKMKIFNNKLPINTNILIPNQDLK